MGMSSHVYGVRNLDGQFAKMIKAKLACEEAGASYPAELQDYFGQYVAESESLLRREMELVDIKAATSKPESEDMVDAWQIDLSKLSPEVKAIRFENSY